MNDNNNNSFGTANMSATKCCIHLNKVPNSLPVRLFTETTLAKCHLARDHGHIHHFKHKNVILPHRVNSVDGYHVSCYRSFTGIVMEKTDKDANDAEGKKNIPLFAFCIFCSADCVTSIAMLFIEMKIFLCRLSLSPFPSTALDSVYVHSHIIEL